PTVSMATARPFVHGGSRLFQFDRNGKFTREIGQGAYGVLFAAQVRVDPQDNIWVVDEMSAMVMKFDPQGRVAFLLGRKAEAIQNPPRAGGPGGGGEGGGGRGGGPPGAGPQQDLFNRPTDVAWDAQGNIFVADGRGTNQRVAKFSKDGVFVKSIGQRGNAQGQFPSGATPGASSPASTASPSTRRVTSTSPTPAACGFRCSTTTAPSRTRSRTSATLRPSASRPAQTKRCMSRTPIRRTTSTPPAKSTR